MAATETKKRKREAGPPRVMFTAPARTFERLLKESSLRALKLTVGKKLSLDSKTAVELCQIRDGKTIDLEDEDDFDAFKSYAVSNGVADVKVIVSSPVATSGPPVRAERSDAHQNDRNPSMASGLASNNQAHFNSEIQTNEDPEPRGTVLKATDEMPRSGPKHNEKRTPPSVRPMDSSSADASRDGVTSVSGKKSHPQSKLASSSLDTEKSREHTAELATVPNEVSASGSSPAPQESIEASKPGESGKDKGSEKKSGKKGGVQTNAADATPAQINDVEPPLIASPAPSPTLPRPEAEVQAPQPPQEVKKPRAKRLKTSAVVETVDKSNQKQSNAELPTASLPGEETVHNKQSEERQPDNVNDNSPSPSRVEPKIKKRKRDIDDKARGGGSTDLEAAGKSKKRQTASGAGGVMTMPQEGEISAISPVCSNTASADPKSKPSKAKKKNKPTPEEESHYDEALDNVIAKVLAKRVSASSRQIPSTEPVTTTVSSAANDQIDSERPRADSAGADKLPVSNRRKRREKSKVTGVSATTPSGEASENVSSKAIADLDSPNDSRSSTKDGQYSIEQTGFAQGALQKGHSDRAASPPDRTVVKTVPVSRAFVQTSSVTEEQNATETAIAMLSKMSEDQPKSGASTSRAATDSIELLTAARKEAVPPTKDTRQPVAPDSLPSTSSVAHDATRERDENSSSDSGSDSDSDSDGDVPSNTKERAAGDTISSLRDPISSFAIAGLNIDDSMDIDSLLIPKSNVSWRKITMSEDDGNEDKQELMSDVEEGESDEGRNHKNAPRNSLLVRYAPSSASTEEENEDDVDVIGSENVGSAQGSNSMSEIGSFSGDSRSPTKMTVTSRQPTGLREDNSMSPKSDVLATEPDTNILPDKTQSQPSSLLPSFSDVNARGESISTEHVANVAVDRAMEEDDTLFLTSIGKPNQTQSAKPSVTGEFGITHDQLASARLMNETADEGDGGGGTSVSETSKESEERNPSPASVPPSKKPVSQGESKANDTIPHPPSLQSIAFSQNSTVSSSGRGAFGVVKRMKDRYGRNADANVISYSSLNFTESTPVKERRHTRALQLSQPIVTEESGTPHTAAAQVSTQEKSTFLAGDSGKVPLLKKTACATTAAEKPGTGAETAAHPFLQKALSQPSQTTTAPTPVVIQTLHVDRSQSSQDIGNQQKTGSQPSPTHVNSASTESGSITEVEHSEVGQKRPSRNSSPYIPVKDARPTVRPRSPVTSETEEDSGSDDSNNAPLLQQAQNHASRPSIVGLRSLHNIASRRELFSPASKPRHSFALSPATRFTSQTPAEVLDDNDSDDDDSSSSSSDSDSSNQSNIPKDKRAGNAPSHRKRELWI